MNNVMTIIGWLHQETAALIGLIGTLIGATITFCAIRYTESYRKANKTKEHLYNLAAEIGLNRTSCQKIGDDLSLATPISTRAWENTKNSEKLCEMPFEDFKILVVAYLHIEALNHQVIAYLQHRNRYDIERQKGNVLGDELNEVEKKLELSFSIVESHMNYAGIVMKNLLKQEGIL